MEIVGSSFKLQQIDNSSNPTPITDGTTDPTSDVEEPIDPGDTGEGEEEQNAEKIGDIEKENEVAAIDVQKNDQMVSTMNAEQGNTVATDKSIIPKPTNNQIIPNDQQKDMIQQEKEGI